MHFAVLHYFILEPTKQKVAKTCASTTFKRPYVCRWIMTAVWAKRAVNSAATGLRRDKTALLGDQTQTRGYSCMSSKDDHYRVRAEECCLKAVRAEDNSRCIHWLELRRDGWHLAVRRLRC